MLRSFCIPTFTWINAFQTVRHSHTPPDSGWRGPSTPSSCPFQRGDCIPLPGPLVWQKTTIASATTSELTRQGAGGQRRAWGRGTFSCFSQRHRYNTTTLRDFDTALEKVPAIGCNRERSRAITCNHTCNRMRLDAMACNRLQSLSFLIEIANLKSLGFLLS